MKPSSLLSLLVLLLVTAFPLRAEEPCDTGKRLVLQLFDDMKSGNIERLESMLPEGFQSIHQDGARNRSDEIKLLKNLEMGPVSLSDITVTKNGNILVVTYNVSAEETIGGKRLSGTPAPRMSVFQETPEGWKWVAHANLKPMK